MQLYVGVTDNDWFDFLHGQQLQAVPDAPADRPSPDFLAYHRDHVFAP